VGHQVRLRRARPSSGLAQAVERSLDRRRVALAPRALQPLALPLEGAGGHLEHRDRQLLGRVGMGVEPDDPPLAGVELALEAVGRVGDLALRVA
jgi:hypothetical protein